MTREIGEDRANPVLAFTQTCRVVPLDTRTALSAAELCRTLKLATANAVVYATALAHGADLLTCDAHFDGLTGALFIPKIAA
ncbi:MAG: PIN domain-containing protein [Caulobacteraceae bacterium]